VRKTREIQEKPAKRSNRTPDFCREYVRRLQIGKNSRIKGKKQWSGTPEKKAKVSGSCRKPLKCNSVICGESGGTFPVSSLEEEDGIGGEGEKKRRKRALLKGGKEHRIHVNKSLILFEKKKEILVPDAGKGKKKNLGKP